MPQPARLTLFAALALSSLSSLSYFSVALAQKPTLVVSGFGISQDRIDANITKPFEALCGCTVLYEVGNNADRLAKLVARKGNPNVDVVLLADYFAKQAGNQGLLMTLEPGKLSNLSSLYPFAQNPLGDRTGVAFTVYAVSIAYRTDKLSAPIRSWKDLWRPELAGKVALPNITTTQGPPSVWLINKAYGGSDLKPDPGFRQLAKLPVLTYYNQSSQMTALFAQDEIWAAPVARFAWGNLLKTGKPLAWARLSDGQAGLTNTASIVQGSKNVELAYKYIDFMLSQKVQTAQASDLVDSPTNKAVKVSADKAAQLTYGLEQIAGLRFMKPDLVLSVREGWIARWNREVIK